MGTLLYASELIEGFSPYITDPLWLDFLRIRLLAFTDIGDANLAMHRLLEADLDLPLTLEVLRFLSRGGRGELFSPCAKKALSLLQTGEEFLEVLNSALEYFSHLDEEDSRQVIQRLIDTQKDLQSPPHPTSLKAFSDLLYIP